MSARTLDRADEVPAAFDAGRLGRLAWLGLFVASLGWGLLVAFAMIGDRMLSRIGAAPSLHADAIEIARCLIGSGFALAVIGALQTGFGALNRFFSAVLSRSGPRAAPAEPTPVTPPPTERAAAPSRSRRPYHILPDGSVEVETIVGTRRFDSMSEAREFI